MEGVEIQQSTPHPPITLDSKGKGNRIPQFNIQHQIAMPKCTIATVTPHDIFQWPVGLAQLAFGFYPWLLLKSPHLDDERIISNVLSGSFTAPI